MESEIAVEARPVEPIELRGGLKRAPVRARPSASASRWTINGDFVALKPTGVARYAKETVLALDALIAESHPLTRTLDIDLVAPRKFDLPNIPVRVISEFRWPRLPQFWAQAQLPRHSPGGIVSFCNLAPVLWRRHIVCIHDLHTFLRPESYSLAFRLTHRIVLPLLGRNAAVLTTVSNLSRDHLVSHGIAHPEKIIVTFNGSEHALRWRPDRSTIEIPTERPFVLCMGRREPLKNTELILRIASKLNAWGIDICMAGDLDTGAFRADGGGKPRNLHLLGRISDDDLAAAFSKAVAFLFPSRIEGFGLPAVEAMALGCPLVASTSPCLPEICGEAALYAEPDDPDGWVEAVLRIMREPSLASQLVAKGRARANRYSWRRIAETYLRLMVDVSARFGRTASEHGHAREIRRMPAVLPRWTSGAES